MVDEQPARPYDGGGDDDDDNGYQPTVERVYNVSEVEETPAAVVNSFSPPVETEGNVSIVSRELSFGGLPRQWSTGTEGAANKQGFTTKSGGGAIQTIT